MSPTMKVTLDVDGEVVVETIGACVDATDAIKKAMKKHPTLVLGVVPLEVQSSFDDPEPHEHPGQTSIDDRPDLALAMDPPDEPEADGPDEVGDDPFGDEPRGPFGELDPTALEAELAAMRGPDGSDEDGLDS